ncbi:hypothetical protein K7X08_022540 [Anisodus acutangulus]|uniref:Uncharacterized protein n=1 Tax=Anisodus acutangulus TaxID=402998 RepID=A0A9Q1MHZ8_9SOLA|nr:hypothetical protein K7X08_022540 [Anisodus acutangulus]
MASHGNDNLFSSNQVSGITDYSILSAMRRDASDAPSDIHSQNQGFLQETGIQVKNMTQGAAQGAVSVARGAALGVANIAQGAADAVKNTVGTNNPPHDNYLDEFPKNI